jgi:hypothetical protein
MQEPPTTNLLGDGVRIGVGVRIAVGGHVSCTSVGLLDHALLGVCGAVQCLALREEGRLVVRV